MTSPSIDGQAMQRGRSPVRRVLVTAFGVSTAMVLFGGFLDLDAPGLAFNIVTLALIASAATALMLLFAVRFVPTQPDGKLDRPLRDSRNRAHLYAFRLLSIAVLAVLLAAFVRATWFDQVPDAQAYFFWLLAIAMLVVAGPSAVMAWSEPES